MAKKRIQNELPTEDWAPTQAVPDPILNSPYNEPQEYWLYKGGTPSRTPGRRPARYYFKAKRVGSAQGEMDLFKEENEEDLPLVNALRSDVKRWREAGYRGASSVTRDLFRWWNRTDSPRPLFFCQREAVETIIYLLELAIPGRLRATGYQKFELDADNVSLLLQNKKPNFATIAGDFWPKLVDAGSDGSLLSLVRMACKMATGSGKTIVMAMVIAWAFCNRGRNPGSKQFPNAVLVCAPNLTVRKRLQVLCPEDPDNYYDLFDLIPAKYREFLNTGKVLITNWHKFAPKSEHNEGGKSYAVVDKGDESHEAFAKDRLGELAGRMPILVLNDEGHHCWRGKTLDAKEQRKSLQDLNKDEKNYLKGEADEARVWLAGLDRINNSGIAGKDAEGRALPAILACIDTSATPFYLANSGFPQGSPFPWIVSDFGLVDAIESGITKVPRLPVKDDSGKKDEVGRPDPQYFRLWASVKDQMKPEDYISKGRPKPEAVFKYAEGALVMLAAQWKTQFDEYKKDAAGKPFIPPVLIVVCDTTEISQVFFEKISGETEVETSDDKGKTIKVKRYGSSSVFAELANDENSQRTIRIDSKLLAKLDAEEGETKDQAALRMREIIDTVGKRGGAGEHIRCVVSVSMLTEGWDACNVTHVLGVRAFDSQLLCEQVVGRGLRRMSYDPNPETGRLNAEYVDVYGIPFSLIPFKGKPKDKEPGPDPVYHGIYAVPERAAFEIRMPNVESYVYALREGGIRPDWNNMEGFIVDKEPGEVWLAPTKGYQDEDVGRSDDSDFVKQTREEYYKSIRPQQIFFRLAQLILDDLMQGDESSGENRGKLKRLARHQLFPELLQIVRKYVNTKVEFRPDVDIRELGLERYAGMIRERVRDNILPAASKDSKLLPVLNSFQPFTTTTNVNYQTTRPVCDLEKSHLNRAMLQSGDEQRAIEILESLDSVECFTPNDRQIGLLVPYEYDAHRHNYEPDFVVQMKGGTLVMLEVKGVKGKIHNPDQVLEKNAAAKKWVAAVNNMSRYGTWAYEICEELGILRDVLKQHCETDPDEQVFRFVDPKDGDHWKTCVPLTSLQVAAGLFSDEQANLDGPGEWSQDWISWPDAPKFEKGMFVARIRGKSMEPDIPDGSYCLFGQPPAGTRQGKTLLVWHSGIMDPSTSGQYTVKVYESEKRGDVDGEWQHSRITLKPRNPDFEPIILEPEEEGDVRIIAEVVRVIG